MAVYEKTEILQQIDVVNGETDAQRLIVELASALARMAAREDDAADNGALIVHPRRCGH